MGTVYQITGTNKWASQIRKKDVYIYEKFDTREEASEFDKRTEARLAKEKAEASIPSATLPASGDLKDEKVLTTLRLYAKSDACTARHRQAFTTLLRSIDDPSIGELTVGWLKAYIARMRRTLTYRGEVYAFGSIHKYLTTLNIALKWRAETLNMPAPFFPYSPKKMYPKGWRNDRERRLDPHEERMIMDHIQSINFPNKKHWKMLIRLTLETGARQQEIVLAKWSEFDIKGSKESVWTIPALHSKTETRRIVPLTDNAIRILKILRHMSKPGDKRVFECFATPAVVCATFHGWIVKLGIVDLRFHDLRHEAISRWVARERNMSLDIIGLVMGHSSEEMTLKYTHLRGGELAALLV